MALTQCKECKKDVSDTATSCPHCGYTGIKKDRDSAAHEAIKKTTSYKVTCAIFGGLVLWGAYGLLNPSTEKKDKSYAALSEDNKKLADDCMKWTNYLRGDPLIMALDNPHTKQTRITLNTDQGSFKRCDYQTKSGKRLKAEWVLSGEIVQSY